MSACTSIRASGAVILTLWASRCVMGHRVHARYVATALATEVSHDDAGYAINNSIDSGMADAIDSAILANLSLHTKKATYVATALATEVGHDDARYASNSSIGSGMSAAIDSAILANLSLQDKPCMPASADHEFPGVSLGCKKECLCSWSQQCYPHIDGEADPGVCEASVPTLMFASVFLFISVLITVMGIRTLLHVRECFDEMNLTLEENASKEEHASPGAPTS